MSAVTDSPATRRWSWVSCPNPFYLLSAACVLHSSCWSITGGSSGTPPLVVPGLIAGYTLILALTSLLVVRRWKVWDDARSMLVMLLLLCVDLALISDEWVIVSPKQGHGLLAAGFAFSILMTELVTRGLRLNLTWHWKMPHYLQLASIFGWPLILSFVPAGDPLRRGLIHLYFLVTGFSFLPLVLAARRGADAVFMPPGWKWPIHPWSWFVVNTFCCLARGYSLTMAFDPVFKLSREAAINQLLNIADLSFLTPYLLAWGIVIFECGIRSQHRWVRITGHLFVLIGVLFSLPHAPFHRAQAAHIQWLHELGLVPWSMALIGGTLCYLWMVHRGSRLAPWGVLAGLMSLGVTSGSIPPLVLPVDSWDTFPIWMAAIWWALQRDLRTSSLHQIAQAALVVLGLYGEEWLAHPSFSAGGLSLRIIVLSVIAAAAGGIDRFSIRLRPLVVVLSLIQSLILLSMQIIMHPQMVATLIDCWMTLLATGSVAVVSTNPRYQLAACWNAGLSYTLHFLIGCQIINACYHWSGWPTFAAGLLLLHLGLLNSLWKGRTKTATQPMTPL